MYLSKEKDSQAKVTCTFFYPKIRYLEKDGEKGIAYLQKIAASGDSEAQYYLAIFYIIGTGYLPKDYDKAKELLERSAEQGNRSAQIELGRFYFSFLGLSFYCGFFYSRSVVERRELNLLKEAAGKDSAVFKHTKALLSRKEQLKEREAHYDLQKSKVKRYIKSFLEMPKFNLFSPEEGYMKLQQDYNFSQRRYNHDILVLLQDAAEAGYSPAQNDLGLFLMDLLGFSWRNVESRFFRIRSRGFLTKHEHVALKWLKKASLKNFPPALLYLGTYYMEMRELDGDLCCVKGMQKIMLAAEKGYEPAQEAISYYKKVEISYFEDLHDLFDLEDREICYRMFKPEPRKRCHSDCYCSDLEVLQKRGCASVSNKRVWIMGD